MLIRMARPSRYHGLARGATSLLGWGAALWSIGCYSHGETTCKQENSALAPLRGNVIVKFIEPIADAGADADGGVARVERSGPGAGALVFVELCDLYSENPDPSKAHPNYRYVALADDAGNFKLDVPKGTVGLHTLLEGYTYGSLLVPDSTSPDVHVVNSEALNGRPQPKASDFVVTPTQATQGATLTFSLKIQAATSDPISEEVLLGEPISGLARAFAPPRRGRPGQGFPDGIWTLNLPAPPPGTYTYFAQAVSEQCAVSTRLAVQVTVQ